MPCAGSGGLRPFESRPPQPVSGERAWTRITRGKNEEEEEEEFIFVGVNFLRRSMFVDLLSLFVDVWFSSFFLQMFVEMRFSLIARRFRHTLATRHALGAGRHARSDHPCNSTGSTTTTMATTWRDARQGGGPAPIQEARADLRLVMCYVYVIFVVVKSSRTPRTHAFSGMRETILRRQVCTRVL